MIMTSWVKADGMMARILPHGLLFQALTGHLEFVPKWEYHSYLGNWKDAAEEWLILSGFNQYYEGHYATPVKE